jgi:hypothetical protein
MTDEQTAAAIVADSRNACDETAMEAAIVRALQDAREEAGRDGVVAGHMTRKAPAGHIIDDAGVVRKVVARSIGPVPWPADVPWVHHLRVAATEHEMEQAANAERGTP